ncbi:hypothetical protein B9C57_02915 [Tenacibaculum maritimum]|nr:hypothetical protein B9C57_02915 [Tenacibaculum maritimum]CAA0182898.1 Protein of unknown function precursor containing TRP domains [Tenacibaculum maritimum]
MKFIYFKKSFFCFFPFIFMSHIVAQTTAIDYHKNTDYHKAVTLFFNKSYAPAQQLFEKITKEAEPNQNVKANAAYYEAMSAIHLKQIDANQKVLNFVKNYPYSSKKEKAFLNVGNYYFANQKAAHALKWYEKVNEDLLNNEDRRVLNFKMGYALLASGYLKKAKEKFITLLGDPQFGNDARYYYGYIAYKEENFGEAENNLSHLADNATYKSKANYYLLDISFKSGKFEKSIQIGKSILPKADKKQQSQISKIIGESYFNLKKYKEAIPYLTQYKGKKGKWNNTDYYYLGYAYYKQGDFENAIRNFNKIIGAKNIVAQNAYYHLGECYLKLNKKPEALNAFKNASEMRFDVKVTEGAALNYAKLSYEEGNPYKSVPEVLKEYLIKYPNTPNTNEIRQLLVTSYLHQGDYEGALVYLISHKSPENEAFASEVALYRGIQLFNEQKLNKARTFFTIAATSNAQDIRDKALFWNAEIEYLQGGYEKALQNFLLLKNTSIEEADNLDYNIAYAYFKLKKYKEATNYFQRFLNDKVNDLDLNGDASNRLGDSFYATKQYNNAIQSYDKVIADGAIGSDYAQYQKAMSNGLAGNNTNKIDDLLAVINNYDHSQLKDDARFQLASTYTSLGNNAKAQEAYHDLLTNHPKSSYVPNVLLRQGLLFYGENNTEKALSKFKEVVANHPNSNEAKQAVTNARNVYIDLGRVDEYADWVKNINFINVSNADLDNATFEAAENKFLENKTAPAIEGFHKYLEAFPNGLHILKAHFHLAQLYLKTNQAIQSIPHYTFVVTQQKSEYSEESLNKLSQLYLEKNDWNNAMPLLKRLEQEANYPQNLTYALSNLMKGYYQGKDYLKAIEYAEKVLSNGKIEPSVEEDAKIIIARAAFQTNDYMTAEEYFNEVGKKAVGKLKAESLYYNAFFKHDTKEYELSNKIIQNLIANYSMYKYWGVKSYIIMAKNYYALKDAYQATYILENIIQNFTQYEDVIREAKNELRTIKNNEAKTNESVTPQQN